MKKISKRYLQILLLAFAYFVSAWLGMRLSIAMGNVSPVWPATGITIAALLLFGYGIWPGILLGVFFSTLTTDAPHLFMSPVAGIAAISEAVLATYLIRRLSGPGYPLLTPTDVFKYFVFAGSLATALSATLGIAGMCLGGIAEWQSYWSLWSTWWLGDMMGAVVVAPAILTWWQLGPYRLPKRQEIIQITLMLILGVGVNYLAFVTQIGPDALGYSLVFLSVPLLLWPAFRFGHHGGVTAIAFTAAIAIWGTQKGFGPFSMGSTNTSLLLLQCFIGVMAMTVLVLAASLSEQRRTESALVKQAEELARSNADLKQFAYVSSHDLQEPLRMITSYCQLLRQRFGNALGADGNLFIRYATDGALRMQAIIEDLLSYTRLGRHHNSLRVVEASFLLAQAIANLKPKIEESSVSITHDPLPKICGDPAQLTILFQNLISNSIKYKHEAKSPNIHVSAKQVDSHWVFAVQDNGIGIDPQYHQRIFLIFQRLHTKDKYPGTGMGLAICKKIVEDHGGQIWVNSELGKGSVFSFSLKK